MPDPAQRDYVLSVAALTDVGQSRGHNEDYVGHYEPPEDEMLRTLGALFVVCDGVGGGSAGEVASEHAVRRILSDYYQPDNQGSPQERLVTAIQRANTDIFQENQRRGEDRRMATTVVTALLIGRQALLAHAGDSRAYVARDGKAYQLTQDHSWVAEMVQSGDLTPQEAANHPWRNRITRSLGMSENVKVETKAVQVQPGDKLLLCSDGLIRYVNDEEIAAALQQPAQQAAKQLIEMANSRGGADNISALVVELLPEAVARQREATALAAPAPSPAPLAPSEMPTISDRTRRGHGGLFIAVGAAGALLVLVVAVVFASGLLRSDSPRTTPTLLAQATTDAPTPAATAESSATAEPSATPTESALAIPTEMSPLATVIIPLETLIPTAEPTATAGSGSSGGVSPSPERPLVEGIVVAPLGLVLRIFPSVQAESLLTLHVDDVLQVLGWSLQAENSKCQSGLWLQAYVSMSDDTGWVCADANLVEINSLEVTTGLLDDLGVPEATPEPAPETSPTPNSGVGFVPGPALRLLASEARVLVAAWLAGDEPPSRIELESIARAGLPYIRQALTEQPPTLPAAELPEVLAPGAPAIELPEWGEPLLPELELPELPDLGL